MTSSRRACCAASLLTLAACSSSTAPTRVAALAVSPDPITLLRGDSVQLSVSAIDASGRLVTGVSVTFASNNPSLVTVTAVGLVKSVGAAGTTAIRVQGGGVTKDVPATVTQLPAAVVLTPTDTAVPQRRTAQFQAMVVDEFGDPVPGQAVTFTSSDTTIVQMSETGLATSLGPIGTVFITARNGPRSALARLVVHDSAIAARRLLPDGALGIATSGDIAYITRVHAGKVQRLDLATLQFTDSVIVGSLPSFVTFDPAGTTAYVANQFSRNVGVIDVATSQQSRVIPVNGDPLPVAISLDGNTLFTTTNVNRLYKITAATGAIVDSLDLPATSHHLLVHPNDTLFYVATRDGGSVLEVNWRTMAVVRTFTLGGRPQGMAIAPDRSELYVANEHSNVLQIIALSNGAVTSVPLADGGEGLALSADGATLYVGLVFAGRVQVIDRASRTILQTIITGGVPREIATDAARQQVLVANEAGWVDVLR